MNRLLKIDTSKGSNEPYVLDIDDKTAIGITFQSYDVKDPQSRRVSASNSFTIPATSHNLSVFGSPSDPQSLSEIIYKKAICNYWVDNEQLVTDARVRVDSIEDRITLFIYEKKNIWDLIKLTPWTEFVNSYKYWLYSYKGVPSASNPYPI